MRTLALETLPKFPRGGGFGLAKVSSYNMVAVYMIITALTVQELIITIIIMGLESVSASEDVIGDLPSPWATVNS